MLMSPMQRYFTSRNSSIPYFEPSRPIPDCFTPPKGATSVENDANMLPTPLVHSDGPHHHHLDNCAFGGPDMKSLYITEALSGDVLVAQMPVAGKKLYGLQ